MKKWGTSEKNRDSELPIEIKFIDLPGYKSITTSFIDKDIEKTNELTEEYIKEGNAFLVVVIDANGLRSSVVTKLILDHFDQCSNLQEKRAFSKRIFWCITKCDVYQNQNVPEEIKTVMENKLEGTVFEDNGWFAAITDSISLPDCLTDEIRIAKIHDNENIVFNSMPFFNRNTVRNRVGSMNLLEAIIKYVLADA